MYEHHAPALCCAMSNLYHVKNVDVAHKQHIPKTSLNILGFDETELV